MKHTILGIETSCDETAVALLETQGELSFTSLYAPRIHVRKHLVLSQIPIHRRFGGVVPEVAARSHVAAIISLLKQARMFRRPFLFDAIAVTRGPGLATALRVGVEVARCMAYVTRKSLIGVNHLEGHVASAWLDSKARARWTFPLLVLIVSGGHTELVLMRGFGSYRVLGCTRDDAAGEAFDKTAKLMGLPYPGGPEIARLAQHGDVRSVPLPRPMLRDPGLDMSFSGLKTAVRLAWQSPSRPTQEDLAASVQQAIIDVLLEKTIRAVRLYRVRGVVLVGGVSANQELRKQMAERLQHETQDVLFFPSDRQYVTDNAAMIAAAGYWRLCLGQRHDWRRLNVRPEWKLGTHSRA